MESVRRHIESQVLSLTGLAVGGVDFELPKGDPGLFGPDAACWKVHGDFSSMMIGGIGRCSCRCSIRWPGGWDHSISATTCSGACVVPVSSSRPPPTARWPMPSD